MSLKELLKNKLYVRIGLAILMLIATALVYFVDLRPGSDFASTKVLEYKFQNTSLDEVEKTVREVENPAKVMTTTDGKIVFSFQNISDEDIKLIDTKLGEKYQFILEMKKYEDHPTQDLLIKYRAVNILIFSLIGALVILFLSTLKKIKFIDNMKFLTVFLLSLLFEVVLFSGLAVLLGLAGIKLDLVVVEIFVLVILYSLTIKFILFESSIEKMKETGAKMSEAWAMAIEAKRKTVIDLMIISLVFLLPSIVGLSFLRSYLIVFILSLPIVALSVFQVTGNLLDVKLKR